MNDDLLEYMRNFQPVATNNSDPGKKQEEFPEEFEEPLDLEEEKPDIIKNSNMPGDLASMGGSDLKI